MPLTFTYSDPQGEDEPTVNVSLSSNTVRFGTLRIAQAAVLGETAISGLEVDDPDGLWDFQGLRALTIRETSAGSNNDVLLRARMALRHVKRGASTRTGAGRTWSIDLVDYNWILGSRILVDADSNRPAETAGDRIRWLLHNAAHVSLYDYGYVTYPSQHVDAADYRGQRAIDVLADCCAEGGYNFWSDYNEAHNRSELFFMDPDSAAYASTLRISNSTADVDYVATFPPDEDAELTRDPSRVAFGVYLAYAKGSVYVRNQTTGEQFAKIDQTAPMSNVKTAARARRVATKFLNDNDEEDDRITCSVWLPPDKVNSIRHGHRISVRFTHFPGWEAFRWARVMRRTIVQDPETSAYRGDGTTLDPHEGWYRLDLELSPSGATASCSTAIGTADTASGGASVLGDPASGSVSLTPTADGTLFAGFTWQDSRPSYDPNDISGFTTIEKFTAGSDPGAAILAYRSSTSGSGVTATSTIANQFSYATYGGHVVNLPGTWTVVQSATASYPYATFASTPTTGNVILMLAGSAYGTPDSSDLLEPGAYPGSGPSTGWTRLGRTTVDSTSPSDYGSQSGIWARCAVAADGVNYGIGGGSDPAAAHQVIIVELAAG